MFAITSTSKYTIHLNVKCLATCLIINFMKLPVDGYPKNRKSIRYDVQ